MTSKSLKRARAKQQKQQEEVKKPIVKQARKDWARAISEAMTACNWQQAIDSLRSMRSAGQVPKLGAVQRWVRLADLSGREDLAAALLDAVMRTAAGKGTQQKAQVPGPAAVSSDPTPTPGQGGAGTGGGNVQLEGSIRRHPAWSPPQPPPELSAEEKLGVERAAEAAVARSEGHVHVVGTDEAPNMTTPNPIFLTDPGVVQFDPEPSPAPSEPAAAAGAAAGAEGGAAPRRVPARVEVPFVDGAFVLTDVLSRKEVAQIVAVSERMGYALDADYTFGAAGAAAGPGPGSAAEADAGAGASAARASAGGERAAGCVWLADDSLMAPVWQRVRGLLPQHLGGGDLAGLNARWRLYRYDQGTVYRPHVDGAWPGSGLKDGKVVFDAFGDRWSRLTFLFYLNDGFEGGSTTFYTPSLDQEGVLEARGVQPRAGNILVFPHGDTNESLVHEGSAVTQGVKYVIRTDVLYKLPPKQGRGAAGAKR